MGETAGAEHTGAASGSGPTRSRGERSTDREFAVGLARAFGGAIFFSLPLLMTMEMWWLGFYMSRLRLALFMLVMIPLLVALDHYSGFKETSSWREDVVDAMVAYGVGFTASALVLALFAVIDTSMPPREIVGKVALQAVPASFGAVLASSLLGGEGRAEEERKRSVGYAGELLFMTAGAMFLAFNVAPTEEMILIAFQMTEWHALALAGTSLVLMHAFVYAVDFRGQHVVPEGTPGWSLFFRFTVVGYAIALGVSAYVLWTFGRYEGVSPETAAMQSVVLGFPASLGAAAARLIL
ncbi:MAG TPA: TIGR02587 family membrane protein [Longimicrobiaceae bacterium]|nr:TIGR02587 family membrane protein [Longimicrobiaceae bacterium]